MNKIRKTRIILMLAGLAFALLGLLFAKSGITFLTPLFLVLAFGGILGHLVYTLACWRCPHCGRLLPIKNGMWNKHCPHCGEEPD